MKLDIVKKDEDIDLLRDAVHSEKIKVARLQKLIQGHKTMAK